jgi:hypothetical protein
MTQFGKIPEMGRVIRITFKRDLSHAEVGGGNIRGFCGHQPKGLSMPHYRLNDAQIATLSGLLQGKADPDFVASVILIRQFPRSYSLPRVTWQGLGRVG